MGTHGFTSVPFASKLARSNTRGIFCGVGVADGGGASLDAVGFDAEAGDDVELVPVAAPVSPEQLTARAQAAPTTTDKVTARAPIMAINASGQG
jgi:hypothetical protein